jgi:adenine C2-methylase RlmN of 23S rRNA A2503 and tRNA A37
MAYKKINAKDDYDKILDNMEEYTKKDTIKVSQDDYLDASEKDQVPQIGKKTAEQLKKYPHEKVIIPLDPLNKQDKYVFVSINDWDLRIERNKAIKLPSPVVEMLEEGGYRPSKVR